MEKVSIKGLVVGVFFQFSDILCKDLAKFALLQGNSVKFYVYHFLIKNVHQIK